MTQLGRTALLFAAAAAVSFFAIEAVAARTKKHRPVAATPSAASKSTGDHGTAAKQEPASTEADDGKTDKANTDTHEQRNTWTDAEIAEAKNHCVAILQRIHAVYASHEPIKEGACGALAPVELISMGQNPEVSFSPPPIVRCDLADALDTWLEKDVQPLARKHFGSPIVKIETMSDYSCRNAYRRKTTKLSEHGLANALDIGTFITASGKTASVMDGWGTPQREILARIAAEKAAAEKQAAALAAANKSAQKNLGGHAGAIVPPLSTASKLGAPAGGVARSTIVEGGPKLTVRLPGASKKTTGGDEPAPDPEVKAFLHEAHEAACNIFGTTLGPEANADHRNHFHVDMAARKYKKICD